MTGDQDLNGNGPRDEDSRTFAEKLVSGGTRGAQRVVGVAGLDKALEAAIEDAIVRAVESDATERAVARILNGPLIEQAVQQALRSDAVEQALLETVDSEMVDRLWGRILDSDETQKLIERIAEAPEVRSAIASQGIGLIGDVGRQVSEVTRRLDFIGQRVIRKVLPRSKPVLPTAHAGFFTRVLAVGIDALVVNVGLVSVTAILSFIATLFGTDFNGLPKELLALGFTTWFVASSLYLFTFWSLSGQTPGMRFLDIRLEHNGSNILGPRVAIRRLFAFWLAAIPFGLGFIGALIRTDRRAFPDKVGRTTVYYVDPTKADAPHDLGVIEEPHQVTAF
ncbi:MAG: RDD family protein [Solirubrobacterales bacterium]